MHHQFDIEPWPTSSDKIVRPAPGIAVVGRSWHGMQVERIAYLIGEIFADLPQNYDTVQIFADFKANKDGHLVDISLAGLTNKLVEPHAMEWIHMKYFISAFLTANADKNPIPTILIECDRSGLQWEQPIMTGNH